MHISKRTGKKIPLDPSTGEPHDCPARSKSKADAKCYGCGAPIDFNDQIVSPGGISIPLEKGTLNKHDCPNKSRHVGQQFGEV